MNPVLLDTHALVWLLSGNTRLGPRARDAIERAAQVNNLVVSAITPWEIAMLVAKGKLTLGQDVGDWIREALAQPGIRLEALAPEIAVASTRLPWEIHPDPADRMIVATARHIDALLVTADQQLLSYSAAGHFKTLPAET